MKFAVSFIATAVATNLVGTTNAAAAAATNSKPMLRASIPAVKDDPTDYYGSIDGQLHLEGTGLSHGLTRNERGQVAACFINSYNEVNDPTDYQVFGFHIKMSHFHAGSNTTTSSSKSLSVVESDKHDEEGEIGTIPHRWPFNTVGLALDYSCSFCGNSFVAASSSSSPMVMDLSDTPPVPPISNDFVVAFQDCLTTGGYNGLDKVSVGLFAPTVTSYLDPPVMLPLSDATTVTSNTLSETANAISANFKTKLSDLPMESDIFLYGLVDELSETDEGIVAQCFIDSYNQQFQTSDWHVDGCSIEWTTVIGGDVNYYYGRQAAGGGAAAVAIGDKKEKNLKGFSYLLMDASLDYACTLCNQDKPQEAKQDHVAFETTLASCLAQSGSTAFDLLETLEVRNMLGATTAMEKNSMTTTN